ncbi:MAG: UDP-2,4-diacetamido-2,4,6-trideoxy-beta-L-altropyranose hydrolase [Methanobrevibacter thaueri]|jgi:UDP-2,4-diacetamido-2,4,6-trideoxy-beta-L-altropyranose hydrolase|uniref:UDP-2,4-diacetamido-2,4, 6-trideoxy-beta-L-altropyranose hydrolase n=1 Tax=Methanobrevibacter thaueri TaxID=190975 RepID=UPI0026ECAD03|nr:UDP-2,4-diacetamido-2,4,6-trideoxy-beta-L-altropyranose hydrolase [Methanobrevibacter thaueri]MBE6496160.1 UDP-2,4-diacetamido-2,4,6-trideoxy-beta-L-altropyranose hydrolase [Methanobrevibacter thaueri]
MNNLLIRVDSTYESGMGHFMRTLALAQKWQKVRDNIYFLINDNENLKKRIISENMEYIVNPFESGSKEDSEFLLDIVKDKCISWVIVDGYVFNEDYLGFLRKNDINYLIFDDDGKKSHYNSNIVLNQNLHGKCEWYSSKKEDYTKLLIGTDFTLLRNEFLEFQNYTKIIKSKANNILVTLGGSDVNNYSLDILKILNSLNFSDFEVIVLIGANNIHEEILNNFIGNLKFNVKILKNISNMPEVMQWADLAFSSGGTTVWELAFMGVPTIVGATSYVEEVLLTGLDDNNLFKTIGKLEDLDKKELINIFDYLINNKDARKKMSIDGQKFIDGYGSKRVIDEMVV